MIVFSDLDGVICNLELGTITMINNAVAAEEPWSHLAEQLYYAERVPLLDIRKILHEEDSFSILTSRPERLRRVTEKWVQKYYPHTRIIFASMEPPVNNESTNMYFRRHAHAKAEVLTALNVDVYFEDTPQVVSILRKLLPNCSVIQYGGRIDSVLY